MRRGTNPSQNKKCFVLVFMSEKFHNLDYSDKKKEISATVIIYLYFIIFAIKNSIELISY